MSSRICGSGTALVNHAPRPLSRSSWCFACGERRWSVLGVHQLVGEGGGAASGGEYLAQVVRDRAAGRPSRRCERRIVDDDAKHVVEVVRDTRGGERTGIAGGDASQLHRAAIAA